MGTEIACPEIGVEDVNLFKRLGLRATPYIRNWTGSGIGVRGVIAAGNSSQTRENLAKKVTG